MNNRFASRCILLLAALGVANVATADVAGYTMTVWTDAAHGGRVLSGDYTRAIEKLTRSTTRLSKDYEGQTNLCVAYAKSGELEKAIASCDQAVAMIEKGLLDIADSRFVPRFAEKQKAVALAIALTNRGVLRMAQGELEQAGADFRTAAELDTEVPAAAINLARFEASQAISSPQIAGG
ncbi:MAG: hypothetical protein AAGA33_03410 [Pseudomonadota bacterium]